MLSVLGRLVEDVAVYTTPPEEIDGAELFGGAFGDIIAGTENDDIILSRGGSDIVTAGAGDDYVTSTDGNDLLRGQDGHDVLVGGSGDDVLRGGDGRDVLHGWDGNDELRGGSGRDLLHGNTGDDILIGNRGFDWLGGNDGDDVLFGGMGRDQLFGGDGADIFVFRDEDGRKDRIFDFEDGIDQITFLDTEIQSFDELVFRNGGIGKVAKGLVIVFDDVDGKILLEGYRTRDVESGVISAADFLFL